MFLCIEVRLLYVRMLYFPNFSTGLANMGSRELETQEKHELISPGHL
jgi:hypothetical protein